MKKKIEEYLSNAETTYATGQYPMTLKYCDKVLNLQPDARAYFLKGSCYLIQEQLAQAASLFEKAIKMKPKEGEYYFYLGLCQYRMKFFQEALYNFGVAETYGVSDELQKKMFYIAGIINQDNNENDAALMNFTKAERLAGKNDDYRDILIRKVQIYVKRNELELAEKCARSLKFTAPNDFHTYQLLFQIYTHKKEYVEAENILKEASIHFKENDVLVEIDFDYAMLFCLRAEMEPEQMQVHYKNAILCLQGIISNRKVQIKDQYEVLLTLTDIYRKLGDIDRAIELSERIVNEPDNNLLELVERAKYNLLEAYLVKKQYRKVQEYALQLKQSKNMMYRYHSYYMEAYSQMMMARAAPDLKKSALRLYQIAIAYYREQMAFQAGDFIALTYRIKANADIGQMEKAEELCNLLPTEAREKMMQYIYQSKQQE